ncbi:hypothetical protein VTK73DRAFT_6296 [Phialemonium thermophilum]|uniref:Uncharacterized protein n=1 Tax=Phialemonium thermophilum TaxID=223376 RepID=A0ABR3UZQ1_9PEZI
MVGDSEEKANLGRALEEIRAVTRECDEKVDEMTKKVALLELQSMLVVRPGFQSVLHLDHLGRELIRQGDLQRQGSKGVRWVDTHALLFDHYFILAKAVGAKDGRGPKKYDVSKEVSLSLSPPPFSLCSLVWFRQEPLSPSDPPVTHKKGSPSPCPSSSSRASTTTPSPSRRAWPPRSPAPRPPRGRARS